MARSLAVTLRVSVCLVAGFAPVGVDSACAQDSTLRIQPLVQSRLTRDFALAGGLLAASLLADHGIRSLVQENRWTAGDRIASAGNRFGEPRLVVPLIGAAWLVGRIAGADRISRSSVRIGKALVLAGGATQLMKFTFGRARPALAGGNIDLFQPFNQRDEFNSFPSGHTAVAWAAATVLATESGSVWVRRALYAGAVTTGFARINNDKHWLSDVVAGAFVGHLAAKMVTSARIRIAPAPSGVAVAFTF
jgi:membrane-associated phospholipid phosphatase